MRRIAGAAVGLLAAVAVGLGATAHPAAAGSCVDVPGVAVDLADADLVIVGSVVSVRYGGRWATMAVEEQWKGDPRGSVVEIRSGSPEAISAIDRSYQVGRRYLAFARESDGAWVDSACSATRPWSDDLAAERPADAVVVGDGSAADGISATDGDGGPPAYVWIAVAAVLVAGFVARRRRTRTA